MPTRSSRTRTSGPRILRAEQQRRPRDRNRVCRIEGGGDQEKRGGSGTDGRCRSFQDLFQHHAPPCRAGGGPGRAPGLHVSVGRLHAELDHDQHPGVIHHAIVRCPIPQCVRRGPHAAVFRGRDHRCRAYGHPLYHWSPLDSEGDSGRRIEGRNARYPSTERNRRCLR